PPMPLAMTISPSASAIPLSCGASGNAAGLPSYGDIAADAAGYDYLSVSFGYTAELWRFWQRCGFTLVR
ncbi:tRNA cytosine(34) acetyltransferase TmcA, partial [Klebsiella pneumoniae]